MGSSLRREHSHGQRQDLENNEPIPRVALPQRTTRMEVIETSLARIAVDCRRLNNVGRLRRPLVSDKFAHGKLYGDYFGVTFYGPPMDGLWQDRLDVSDRFIDPLFGALLDRASRGSGVQHVPTLVMDWNTLQGWADATGVVAVRRSDAEDLATALGDLAADDLAPHASGAAVPGCLECASLVREFLCSRLARGASVYIEHT